MEIDAFENLAETLDRLPNGFPRTATNIETRILRKIFSLGEARLASQLTGTFESLEEIACRANQDPKVIRKLLQGMVRRGLIWFERAGRQLRFRLAPFIVGIYEAQVDSIDHELAHLVEEYFHAGGTRGLMSVQPALHRVVPAQKAVRSEWVLPYDDVRSILLSSKTFNLRDCICRVQKGLISEECDFPKDTCLNFSQFERPPLPGDISKQKRWRSLIGVRRLVWFIRSAM